MEETRVFTGFMDLETAPEYFQEGDYLKARNIKKRSTVGSSSGRLSFFNGTILLDETTLPEGENKTLRAVVEETLECIYSINYNTNGFHTVIKYSDSGSTILFRNITDTNGEDLLGWDANTLVNDAVIHAGRWLLFTDTVKDVRMLDLQKLEQGYGRPIRLQDITLAKAPPSDSPEYYYVDTSELQSNRLSTNLFKFKYKFIYEGGFETSWSATSSEVLPNNLNEVAQGPESDKQNLIRLLIPIREVGVTKVLVAASSNGGEWVLVREMTVQDIEALPTSRTSPLDEVRTGPYWEMSFYNPLAFNLIPADEADHNYEAIPRVAESLDIVNNSTLLLGGLTEGYKRLTNVDVDLTPTQFSTGDYASSINGLITGRGTLKVLRANIVDSHGGQYREYIYIELTGTPVAGDLIKIVLNYGLNGEVRPSASPSSAETFRYRVAQGATSMAQVYAGLANSLPNGQVFTDSEGTYVGFYIRDYNFSEMGQVKTLQSVNIDLTDIGYVDLPTQRTFKRGSTLQFALSYKDNYGRYFPLETSKDFVVEFPQTTYDGLRLNWQINHQPPQGAASYQWMVSEDMKFQNYTYILGEWKKELSKQGRFIMFDLTSLNRYINRGLPGLNYTYTPGDRVYIRTRWYQSSVGGVTYFEELLNSRKELSVVGMEVVPTDGTDSQYLLKTEFNQSMWDELVALQDTGSGMNQIAVKLELFTPKVVDSNMDTTLFREIGPSYRVIDGAHSATAGTLEGIDDFVRGRVYEAFSKTAARGFSIESPFKTDEDSQRIPFKGNVRSYYDQIENRDLRGSIRFSDISGINRVYNGINKFYEGRIYGEGPGETTSKNGWIKKIKVVGNYLKVLQENEVGIIPIHLSMIQDNSGSIQTADSDKLLNTVRYVGGGKIGVGNNARSVAVNEVGDLFFLDSSKGTPYKLQGMTLTNLNSRLGNYFADKVVEPISAGCLHDPINEYWVTLQTSEGVDTLVLDTIRNRWVSFTDNHPEVITNLNGEVYTFKGARRYLLDKFNLSNNFYGSVYPSTVDVLFPAGFVRTFKSVAVHSDAHPETVEDGVNTSLDLVSDLVKKDFKLREGIWYANLLRDKASGLYTGKFLKGKWASINLKFDPDGSLLSLFKVVLKSKGSTPNE